MTKTQGTTGLTTATAMALMLSVTPAHAFTTKVIQGVHFWSDFIRLDQLLPGQPVEQFPLNCERVGSTTPCKYTIQMDFFPGISPGQDPNTCADDPSTPWLDCDQAQCVAWVEFEPLIQPLTDFHGIDPNTGLPAEFAIILQEFRHRPTPSLGFVFSNHDAFHGANGEILRIIAGELTLTPDDNCHLGLAASFSHNSPRIFDRGDLLPPR